GEPDQLGGDAPAFPAATRLEHRVDAAEARSVGDQLRRRLDAHRVAADVEREEAAEASLHEPRCERIGPEARIADALDRRVRGEPTRELEGARRLAADAQLERLEAAQQQ